MNNSHNYCITFILCLICVIFIAYNKSKTNSSNINIDSVDVVDTSYNKVVLDSIQYNIVKKDSVIVKLKYNMKHDVEEALSANDSSVVEQFKSLAGAD